MRQLFTWTVFFTLTACSNSPADKFPADRQTKFTSDSVLENKFERLKERTLTDSTITFRLDTLTNFSWDTLIIIKPFYPIDTLAKKTHTNLTSVGKTFIGDGANVLAFIKDGQLINCVRVPRNTGDFWAIHDKVIFSKDSCIFEFFRTRDKFDSRWWKQKLNNN